MWTYTYMVPMNKSGPPGGEYMARRIVHAEDNAQQHIGVLQSCRLCHVRARSSDGRPGRRGPGELEAEVLTTLWSADVPLTAGQVQARLASPLAYSTVVTIMSRLHAKGTLRRAQQGRAFAYLPVADEPGLAARRMRQVLDGEANRQQVLARFVSDLSDEDERVLRRLLDSHPGTVTKPSSDPEAG